MFRPGERIYVPGASGEPVALSSQIFGFQDVFITTSFAAGVNRLESAALGQGSVVTGLFMQPGLRAAQAQGQFRHLPLSYAAMVKYLRAEPGFDVCVLQVAAPDVRGNCSLGPVAEFLPEVLCRAGRVIAVVNENVPRIATAPTIARADCTLIEAEALPLIGYDVGTPDAASQAIAASIAAYIQDGAVLQIGLGKVPQALMAVLTGRRRLKIHSGMISDGVMALAEAGALDPDFPHTATAILGSPTLYRWAAERSDIHVQGVEHTHDPARLAVLPGLVAVNSALEVDLFGQCNLELADGRAVSGVGGAADFARAARLGPAGISIVALPASFGRDEKSRIKPWLGAGGIVSLSRTEADIIITEHGIADMRGASVYERAEKLVAIAVPAARPALQAAWREIAARL